MGTSSASGQFPPTDAMDYTAPPTPVDLTPFIVGGLVVAFVLGFVGIGIGKSKGRDTDGFFLGLLLGPIGLIIIAVLGPTSAVIAQQQQAELMEYRQCPHCKERMRRDAGTCPHCRLESEPWQLHEGHWWCQNQWLDEATKTWRAT